MGEPVIVQSNNYLFINFRGDTLLLRPGAPLNQSWIFAKRTNGEIIEATVTSASISTVFGVPDSIKHISLLVKSSNGTVIPDSTIGLFNLIVSKNNGLVEGFPFYYFDPELNILPWHLIHKYYLAGFQNGTGRKLPTNETIYDFQVGDRFHYVGNYYRYVVTAGIYEIGPIDHYKTRRTIVSNVSTPGTILYGIVDSVEYNTNINYSHSPYNPGTYVTNYSVTQSFIEKPANAGYILPNRAPVDSFIFPGWSRVNRYRSSEVFLFKTTNYRSIEIQGVQFDQNYQFNDCFFEYGPVRTYIEGQGLGTIFALEGLNYNYYSTELVYFQKGNNTGGTPIFFTSVPDLAIKSIDVVPNPAYDVVTVHVAAGSVKNLIVQDLHGRTWIAQKSENGSTRYELDVRQLNAGLYIISVTTEDGLRQSTKFLKN